MQPETAFRRGIAALKVGRADEAARHFQSAISLEKRMRSPSQQMRYLSYYGLSLGMAYGPTHQSLRLCEQAAAHDHLDPLLRLNLARVYLMAHKTTKALATIQRGLALDPSHQGLRALLERVDRRARPVIPLLGRNHRLNRSLGRLRASLLGPRP